MKLLTLQEAADALKVHVDTARRLAQRGELPGAFKLGGSWRVNWSAYEQPPVAILPSEPQHAVSESQNRGGWR